MTHELSSDRLNFHDSNKEVLGLHGCISAMFEGEIEPDGYKVRFSLPVSSELSDFIQSDREACLSFFTQRSIRNEPWQLELTYDSLSQSIEINSLTMPLKSPQNDEELAFRRTTKQDQTFTAFSGQPKQPATITNPLLDSEYLNILLSKAGYPLPKTADSPDDLRLKLAQLADNSSDFKIQEHATLLINPNQELDASRTTVGLPCDMPQLFNTELTATISEYTDDGIALRQQIVKFEDDDFDLAPPEITIVVPDNTHPGCRDFSEYEQSTAYPINPSPKVLELIEEGLFDAQYGGDYAED